MEQPITVPPAEVPIDAALVSALVSSQFPEFSGLEVSFLGSGWDNENYRLGNTYMVRLPRRAISVPLLEKEMAQLPRLAPLLPIEIPAAVRLGAPGDLFPWVWCIVPWHEGGIGGELAASEALRMAEFLRVLHQQPTDAVLTSTYRGMPLANKEQEMKALFERLRPESPLVNAHLGQIWAEAVQAPFPEAQSLLHGDLHPRNVVIDQGRIAAIIDWGDLCKGDPATDLASFWMLFSDAAARSEGIARYGADAATIARAKGWAAMLGLILLDIGCGGDASYRENGEQILRNLG